MAWRKLVQMSAFFFLPRVTGGLEGCTIIRSSDLLKADFLGPNPGGTGYNLVTIDSVPIGVELPEKLNKI